jgi:hypothetical protein
VWKSVLLTTTPTVRSASLSLVKTRAALSGALFPGLLPVREARGRRRGTGRSLRGGNDISRLPPYFTAGAVVVPDVVVVDPLTVVEPVLTETVVVEPVAGAGTGAGAGAVRTCFAA